MSVDGLKFVRRHGVVLESAKGPVPNLAEAIAGAPIRGNWWNHPDGRRIFRITRLVRDSEKVLICRLVDNKITYIDRGLWPAIIRLSPYLNKKALAALREVHTASGKHRIISVPFPRWAPVEARKAAEALSETDAVAKVGLWIAKFMEKGSRSRTGSRTPTPAPKSKKPKRQPE